MRSFVVFGGSRGLGEALCHGLPKPGDRLWSVSRTPPVEISPSGVDGSWICSDLRRPTEASAAVAQALGTESIDVLIYNAGIWEESAFSDNYRFDAVPDEETLSIISVNLASVITCLRAIDGNLSPGARVILIGSTSGLENTGSREVSYVASKFGLRGAAQALREHGRSRGISVTVINLGEIAADVSWKVGKDRALSTHRGKRIPVGDVVDLVRCVLELSKAACVKEIDVPAMEDFNA